MARQKTGNFTCVLSFILLNWSFLSVCSANSTISIEIVDCEDTLISPTECHLDEAGGDLIIKPVLSTDPVCPGSPCNVNLEVHIASTEGDHRCIDEINYTPDGVNTWNSALQYRFGCNADTFRDLDSRNLITLKVVSSDDPLYVGVASAPITIRCLDSDADTPAVCGCHDDPHMYTFDLLRYEHHMDGVFVLFKDEKFDVEVQARFRPCNHRYGRCNRGVAIRHRDVAVIFDPIEGQIRALQQQSGHRNGIGIFRSGTLLQVHLPGEVGSSNRIGRESGLRVDLACYGGCLVANQKIDWIKIYPRSNLRRHSLGLCGFFNDNNNVSNDILMPDYATETAACDPVYTENCSYSSFPHFGEAWRASNVGIRKASLCGDLFTMTAAELAACPTFSIPGLPTDVCYNRLCRTAAPCPPGHAKYEVYIKGYTDITATIMDLPLDDPLRSVPANKYSPGTPRSSPISSTLDTKDADFRVTKQQEPVMGFPTPSGITEDVARDYCERRINNEVSMECSKTFAHVNLPESVKYCMLDVQLSDSFDFVDAAVESDLHNCLTELHRVSSKWEDDGQGGLAPKRSLVKAICGSEDGETCDKGIVMPEPTPAPASASPGPTSCTSLL